MFRRNFLVNRVGDSRLCPCVRTAIGVASRWTFRFPAFHRGKSASADVMFRAKHHLPLGKRHLPLAKRHLPLAKRHLPLGKRHLPLGKHRLT
jgi:hypothetical protein